MIHCKPKFQADSTRIVACTKYCNCQYRNFTRKGMAETHTSCSCHGIGIFSPKVKIIFSPFEIILTSRYHLVWRAKKNNLDMQTGEGDLFQNSTKCAKTIMLHDTIHPERVTYLPTTRHRKILKR
mmetsp:Transcript_17660/g.38587  ORF Transcript_17660/g.38587 Transcript_17660/m.38587 type:complete len:125 (+) Transcript_17660:89-463(+)